MSRIRQRSQQSLAHISQMQSVQQRARANVAAASDAAAAKQATVTVANSVSAINVDGITSDIAQLRRDVDALQATP